MADVTIITPTLQVQTVGASEQQPQNASQTSGTKTAYLSPGALVAGTIIGKDTNGNFLLRTSQGTFPLQSDSPLTYNSDVLIRIGPSQLGNATARIVSVNGEAYASYSTPAEADSDSVSPSLLARSAASEASNIANATPATVRTVSVQAVTLPPPPAADTATPSPPAAPVPEQTEVTLHYTVTTSSPPPSAAEQLSPSEQSTTPLPTQADASPTSTPSAFTPSPASLPENTSYSSTSSTPQQGATASPASSPPTNTTTVQLPRVQVDATPTNVSKLIAPQPEQLSQAPQSAQSPFAPLSREEASTPTALPSTLQGPLYATYAKSNASSVSLTSSPPELPIPLPTVEATLVTTHPDGTLTLLTPQGTLTVKPESLPEGFSPQPGDTLTLTLPPTLSQIFSTPAPSTTSTSIADRVKDILTVLQTESPQAATALLTRLPTMGANFLSSSLLFWMNLIQGNVRKALGDEVADGLQATGHEDLLSSLSSPAGSSGVPSPATQEQPAPVWQHYALPFVYDGALQEARLYVKREAPRKEREQKKTSGDTRFILEVSLSQMGELQLDGLVQHKEQKTLCDLIVRTHTPFSPEEQQDMTELYTEAASITGFNGALRFSVSKHFPPLPSAGTPPPHKNDIVA